MKQFLKSTEVKLINGGYLSNSEDAPVYNREFVEAQKHAEYIITFAALAEKKDFVGKKADNLASLELEVRNALAEKETKFVSSPDAPKKTMSDKLAAEAMSFMTFKEDSNKIEKINAFLQQFKVLHEFEEFGLFFEDDIVKLGKIYSMKEITEAVKSVIDLLK